MSTRALFPPLANQPRVRGEQLADAPDCGQPARQTTSRRGSTAAASRRRESGPSAPASEAELGALPVHTHTRARTAVQFGLPGDSTDGQRTAYIAAGRGDIGRSLQRPHLASPPPLSQLLASASGASLCIRDVKTRSVQNSVAQCKTPRVCVCSTGVGVRVRSVEHVRSTECLRSRSTEYGVGVCVRSTYGAGVRSRSTEYSVCMFCVRSARCSAVCCRMCRIVHTYIRSTKHVRTARNSAARRPVCLRTAQCSAVRALAPYIRRSRRWLTPGPSAGRKRRAQPLGRANTAHDPALHTYVYVLI